MDVKHYISKLPDNLRKKNEFTNKSEVYAVGLMMFKFCYWSEPWNMDVLDFSTIKSSGELNVNTIDITTKPKEGSHPSSSLLFVRSACKEGDKQARCQQAKVKEIERLFGNIKVGRYIMSSTRLITLLYAEIITSLDESSMSYSNLHPLVQGNCDQNRFNLIQYMLTREDTYRPNAGGALGILKAIHSKSIHSKT
eukprot:GHVR01150942.1.p1 GENE.GHVR01150942.1~~GHVR01150942.1.p1  ORF type:complete len:195 (+),score=21.76 GHVR01150942.1:170-754(+)